jgi:hypothetical protein
MAGYQWQLHQALIDLVDADLDAHVSIEQFDDVVLHRTRFGAVQTAFAKQTKHSFGTDVMRDSSVDLWKTLRVWCSCWQQHPRPEEFVLATTDTLHESLSCLAPEAKRDPDDIVKLQARLDALASARGNADLKSAFDAWEQIPSADRASLLSRVKIETELARLAQAGPLLKDRLQRTGLQTAQLDFAYEHLLGWFTRTVQERLGPSGCTIERMELNDKLIEIHSLCQPGRLSTLHAGGPHPALDEELADDPVYLRQLALLDAEDDTLQYAVAMLYRARAERDGWLQRRVTGLLDLTEYDRDLRNRWEQIRLRQPPEAQDEKQVGWEVYYSCMAYSGTLCGQAVATHVANGSYHLLANGKDDAPEVGWHPRFLELLEKH